MQKKQWCHWYYHSWDKWHPERAELCPFPAVASSFLSILLGASHLLLSRDFLQLFFAIYCINIRFHLPPHPSVTNEQGTWVLNMQLPLWLETFPLDQVNTGKPQVTVEIHSSKSGVEDLPKSLCNTNGNSCFVSRAPSFLTISEEEFTVLRFWFLSDRDLVLLEWGCYKSNEKQEHSFHCWLWCFYPHLNHMLSQMLLLISLVAVSFWSFNTWPVAIYSNSSFLIFFFYALWNFLFLSFSPFNLLIY